MAVITVINMLKGIENVKGVKLAPNNNPEITNQI